MFGLLTNLTKAAVGVALTPVAVLTDIVTLPTSAGDPRKGPFDKTEHMLKSIGDSVNAALK